MAFAATVNALADGSLQRYLGLTLETELEPLMRLEQFSVQ
jgi:hypothetical protein